MLSPDHDGIIVCGKRKRGKTTLTKALYANEKRVMLYDAKGELKEPLQLQAGEIVPEIWQDKGVLRAMVLRGNKPSEELEWSAFCAIQMGHCVYVVDELPDALEDGEPGESWKWVIRMGRKKDIRFIMTFQRAKEIPPMARANASDWYLFQTNEDTDLDYIRKSTSKEVAEIVRTLVIGQAVRVKDGQFQSIVETDKPMEA